METPLQQDDYSMNQTFKFVTILILVETPLQLILILTINTMNYCHNPYFSGNSFATDIMSGFTFQANRSQSLF